VSVSALAPAETTFKPAGGAGTMDTATWLDWGEIPVEDTPAMAKLYNCPGCKPVMVVEVPMTFCCTGAAATRPPPMPS